MPKNKIDLYEHAHLFVAAIRILSHRKKAPPDLEHVCRTLDISLENGGYILRRLEKEAIVEIVKQPHGDRLFIKSHLNIEDFKGRQTQTDLDEALARFRSEKETMSQKIESIRADQEKKKKDLFAQLNDKLKTSPKPTTDDGC